jgi:DNA-binding CsgD family transcriptional regulator
MDEKFVFSALGMTLLFISATAWHSAQPLPELSDYRLALFFAHYAIVLVSGFSLSLALRAGRGIVPKKYEPPFVLICCLFFLVCCFLTASGHFGHLVEPAWYSCFLSLYYPLCVWCFFSQSSGRTGLMLGMIISLGDLTKIGLKIALPSESYGIDVSSPHVHKFLVALTVFAVICLFFSVGRGKDPRPTMTAGADRKNAGLQRALGWGILAGVFLFAFCGVCMNTSFAALYPPRDLPDNLRFLLLPLPLLAGLWLDSGKNRYALFIVMLVCMGVAYAFFVGATGLDLCDVPLRLARRLFLMVLLCCGWNLLGDIHFFPLLCATSHCLYAFRYLGLVWARFIDAAPAGIPYPRQIVGAILLLGSSLFLFFFFRRLDGVPLGRAPAFPDPALHPPVHIGKSDAAHAVPDEIAHLARRYGLSKREREIVDGLLRGLGTDEMASALKLKRNTIRHYIYLLFRKTGVESRVQLLSLARGLVRDAGEYPRN